MSTLNQHQHQPQQTQTHQRHNSTTFLKTGTSVPPSGAFQGTGESYGLLSNVANNGQLFCQRPDSRTSAFDQEFTFSSQPTLRSSALVQPPPLTRHAPSQHKAVMDSLSNQLSGPLLWYPPPADIYRRASSLDSVYDTTGRVNSLGYIEYAIGPPPPPPPPLHKTKTKKQKSTKPRNPSPYNMFMSQEVKHIKAMNPKVDHKEAFKMAASNWAKCPNSCTIRRESPTIETELTSTESSETTTPKHEEQQLKNKNTNTMTSIKRMASELSSENSIPKEDKRMRMTETKILEAST
eukprot:g8211.t1